MNLLSWQPQQGLVELLALTLLHSLWQGTLIAVALKALLWHLRRSSPGSRHGLACLALAAMMLTSCLTFQHLHAQRPVIVDLPWAAFTGQSVPQDARVQAPAGRADTLAAPGDVIPAERKVSSSLSRRWAMHWQQLVVGTWLLGMLGLTARHTAGWLGLSRLRRHGIHPATPEFEAMLEQLRKVMGIHRRVTIRFSDCVAGPIAMGCFQLLILVPSSLTSRLSMQQWQMVLAHELAHLRRNDFLINLLQAAAETVYFYHPAMWWINAQIRREREHACDDAAVRATQNRHDYARALVELAECQLCPTPALAMAATRSTGGELRRRVERLLTPEPSAPPAFRSLPGLGTIALVLLAIFAPSAPQTVLAEGTPGPLPPKRGEIRDRNGIVLAADSRPDRQIIFDTEAVVKAWQAKHGETLPMEEFEFTTKEGEKAKGRRVNVSTVFTDICTPALEKTGLIRSYNASQLQRSYREKRPFMYRTDLSQEEYVTAGKLTGTIPGLSIRTRYLRHYPYQALAGQVLGYVRKSSTDEGLTEGTAGVEKGWNKELSPTPGDDKANASEKPSPPSNLQLTLDLRYQFLIERILREAKVGRGAAVLMDPHSGDVLAMVSLPSYDPNHFIPSISQKQFETYRDDPTVPLLARAVRGYVPGSTFMAVTALAGVMTGHENDQYECTGSLKVGGKSLNCWIKSRDGRHSFQTMDQAMGNGCGPYFYALGMAIGGVKLENSGALLGLGRRSGIGLWEESEGTMPGPAWLERDRLARKTSFPEKWSEGNTCNMAIGQGAVETTPLQLANVYASIANGGTVWRPRLLASIASPGSESPTPAPQVRAANLREHGLTETGLELIRSGITKSTERLRPNHHAPVRMAVRSGLAQHWRNDRQSKEMVKDNIACVAGYYPADKPRWVLSLVVQNSRTSGGVTLPLAERIFEQVAAVESGSLKVDIQPLPPAQGHFNLVEPAGDTGTDG